MVDRVVLEAAVLVPSWRDGQMRVLLTTLAMMIAPGRISSREMMTSRMLLRKRLTLEMLMLSSYREDASETCRL